jgi:hypothetical protein
MSRYKGSISRGSTPSNAAIGMIRRPQMRSSIKVAIPVSKVAVTRTPSSMRPKPRSESRSRLPSKDNQSMRYASTTANQVSRKNTVRAEIMIGLVGCMRDATVPGGLSYVGVSILGPGLCPCGLPHDCTQVNLSQDALPCWSRWVIKRDGKSIVKNKGFWRRRADSNR